MKIIVLDTNGNYVNIFEDDLPDYGDRIKTRADPEVGLSILWVEFTKPTKCQACSINPRINNKSLHCEVCIIEMMKNRLNMLLEGTMNDTPMENI